MDIRRSLLAAALALAAAAPAIAQTTMTSADAHELLLRAGFSDPTELIFVDGRWRTEAKHPDGDRVKLLIDPATREIRVSRPEDRIHIITTERTTTRTVPMQVPVTTRLLTAPLTGPDIELLLNDAGFRGVHDIEFRNGAWKAEAYDAYGDDLEIIVDADSGRILQVMDD